MPRMILLAVLSTAIVAVVLIPGAQAQYQRASGQRAAYWRPSASTVNYAPPKKIVIDPDQLGGSPRAMTSGGQAVAMPAQQSGYVRLSAPMYPVPRPDIPYQVGATMITNQAFAPHEMLYPHTYRAMYPPYYYRVRGKWIGFAGGSHAYERWELQGTEVEIEYSSTLPLLSRFRNPFAR